MWRDLTFLSEGANRVGPMSSLPTGPPDRVAATSGGGSEGSPPGPTPEDTVTAPSDPSDYQSEAPPSPLVAQAKALFSQKSQGDLAVLVFDSLLDCDDPPEDHRLRFDHSSMSVEVRVSVTSSDASLDGQVQPPLATAVEVEAHMGGRVRIPDSSGGGFSVSGIPHGLVRLHLVGGSSADPPIHTDWFRV